MKPLLSLKPLGDLNKWELTISSKETGRKLSQETWTKIHANLWNANLYLLARNTQPSFQVRRVLEDGRTEYELFVIINRYRTNMVYTKMCHLRLGCLYTPLHSWSQIPMQDPIKIIIEAAYEELKPTRRKSYAAY